MNRENSFWQVVRDDVTAIPRFVFLVLFAVVVSWATGLDVNGIISGAALYAACVALQKLERLS